MWRGFSVSLSCLLAFNHAGCWAVTLTTLQLWVVQPHPGWNANHVSVAAERIIIYGLQSANKNHENTALCRILSLNCNFGSLLKPGQVSTEWPSLTWTLLGGTASKHSWRSWVGKWHGGILGLGGLTLPWLQQQHDSRVCCVRGDGEENWGAGSHKGKCLMGKLFVYFKW